MRLKRAILRAFGDDLELAESLEKIERCLT